MSERVILHVEDDKLYSDIIRKALEAQGFSVQHVSSGEEALRRAASADLVLLDIGLPQKDGFDVLEELKAQPETRAVPVVMLSRLSAKEDVDECRSLGCAEYLIKTQHSPEDIANHVRRILAGRPAFSTLQAIGIVSVILVLAGLLYWQWTHPRPAPLAPSVPNQVPLGMP
ncbi:MAG TPA: response regulator [Verrucomicrobiae bacterium]|nr:response regulator [Verrucomicrobiae bacterium]